MGSGFPCVVAAMEMLMASAKSWRVRRASHQLVLVGSCLTISHTCLPCLPSGGVNPCVICPLMTELIHNGGSVDGLLHGEYGFSSVGTYCFSRKWLWN